MLFALGHLRSSNATLIESDSLAPMPVGETDLVVQDYSDEEAEVSAPRPQWPPGSFAARELMKARAKHCIICLSEKEHSLVPPHSVQRNVEGHVVCTECWAKFLRCAAKKRARPLCPVCRDILIVPDVWALQVEMPKSWSLSVPPKPASQQIPAHNTGGSHGSHGPQEAERPKLSLAEWLERWLTRRLHIRGSHGSRSDH